MTTDKETGSTKVYKYGALSAGDDVCEQMRLGHAYYNQLVEAENERRMQRWGGPHAPAPPHETPKDKDSCACQECKDHWGVISTAVYAAPGLDIGVLRRAAAKGGLFWGTYNRVEEAFGAAREKTIAAKKIKFRPWRKNNQIAVQIQKSTKPENSYRVVLAPEAAGRIEHNLLADTRDRGTKKRRHDTLSRRTGQRRTLQIRIGSIGRQPIWSDPIPFVMHRPLKGKVVRVFVCRQHVADREVWSVQFVCREVQPGHSDSRPRGVVAIDVGWRKIPSGETRIAFARSGRGAECSFNLPISWGKLTEKADDIRSIRDNRVNDLKKDDARFARVRSPKGVARLVAKMRKTGITIEQEVVDWLKQDRHLWQYEEGLRRRSTNRRRNDMRVWLHMLSQKYAVAVIKSSSHKKMKEEKKNKLPRPARRRGHHAAPGEVIEEITKYFGRMENVALVKSVHTTNTCIKCQHVNDHGPEQMITCEQCGHVDDRDSVSTQNMMTAYRAGNYKKPTARKTTARFAKRHKK